MVQFNILPFENDLAIILYVYRILINIVYSSEVKKYQIQENQ